MTLAAIRFNNPGDVSLPIKGWHGAGHIVGIEGQPGYAEFPSMQIGFEAFIQRLVSYIEEGRTTIAKIGQVYATDPHWGYSVARIARMNEHMVLNTNDRIELTKLAEAIIRQETGKTLLALGITGGVLPA